MNPDDPVKRTGADTSIDAPSTPGISFISIYVYLISSSSSQQGSRML